MDTQPSPSPPQSKVVWHFRPAVLLAASVVMLVAVALAYVGGVMSGRASAERELIAKHESSPRVATAVFDEEEGEGRILSGGELEFSRMLRNEQLLPKPLEPVKMPPPDVEIERKSEEDSSQLLSDYVYQVAAVRGDDNADALRQRLEGRGFRTFLKREGKLLLIQIRMRGTRQQAKKVEQILESLHLGKPILVQQKPVYN